MINGLGGSDSITTTANSGNNTITALDGNDTITSGAGDDAIRAGDGANTIDSGDGNDRIETGSGNDLIRGGSGKDYINGGAGWDTMEGGNGSDTYRVNGLHDVVNELNNRGDDVDLVLTSVSWVATPNSNIENFRLMGTANLNLTANSLSNVIFANSGNNVIDGGVFGFDTVSYRYGASSGVTVSLAFTTDQVTGGSGTDRLLNIDALTGSPFADNLTGNGGRNILSGLGGNDTLSAGGSADDIDILRGGLGNDRLTGGTGVDFFDFTTTLNASSNVDTITDFSPGGGEVIRLDDDIFSAFDASLGKALPSGAFRAGAGVTTAQDADDHIIYNTSTGNLYYDPDGAGGASATLFATLPGAPTITEAAFNVIG
jgi:serralysin